MIWECRKSAELPLLSRSFYFWRIPLRALWTRFLVREHVSDCRRLYFSFHNSYDTLGFCRALSNQKSCIIFLTLLILLHMPA